MAKLLRDPQHTYCHVCGIPDGPAHNDLNHEFSLDGRMRKKKTDARNPRSNSVDSASDGSIGVPGDSSLELGLGEPGEGNDGTSSTTIRSVPTADGSDRTALSLNLPSDPVLRMALIDLGLLTPADLTQAETKIAAMIGQSAKQIFRNNPSGSSHD